MTNPVNSGQTKSYSGQTQSYLGQIKIYLGQISLAKYHSVVDWLITIETALDSKKYIQFLFMIF